MKVGCYLSMVAVERIRYQGSISDPFKIIFSILLLSTYSYSSTQHQLDLIWILPQDTLWLEGSKISPLFRNWLYVDVHVWIHVNLDKSPISEYIVVQEVGVNRQNSRKITLSTRKGYFFLICFCYCRNYSKHSTRLFLFLLVFVMHGTWI